MQQDTTSKDMDTKDKGKSAEWRKKRIKRMKMAIIVTIIVLLILPTLLCIILSFRISKLQSQVNDLISMHDSDSDGLAKKAGASNLVAYAAEKTASNLLEDTDLTEITAGGTAGEEDTEDILADEAGKETETDLTENTDNSGNLSIEDTYTEDTNTANTNSGDTKIAETNIEDTKIAETNIEASGADQPVDGIAGEAEDEIKISSTGIYDGKKVYLTFDDGPSKHTDEILDILADYDVKATFFVIGAKDQESARRYQRIVEEGHTLGMHSYSHKYKEIYNSLEDFEKDFTKLWKLLYDTTGYMPTLYRFPGGSSNHVNKNGMEDFIRYLNEQNIIYYDWNVVNGDATGVDYTKDQLIDNVLNGVAVKKTSIVLMHDVLGKDTTVESLPELLEALISGGSQILPLDESVPPIQQIKAENIK